MVVFFLYITVLNVEELIAQVACQQYIVEMVAIGICYKNLTIFIARYKFYYLLHTSGIKLVEDIVEKKKRRRLRYSAAQKLKLRHFQ